MIIECSHCQAKYQYDEAKFDGKPSKKIRCAKCQQVFEILNPRPADEPVAAPPSPPPARVALESTLTRAPKSTRGPDSDPNIARVDNPPLPQTKRFSLAIIDGPSAGTVHRIERARTTIGRSDADINLNDSEASRSHALVDIRGGTVVLQDLGSTNGTVHGGERIAGPVELQNHGEFQIGSTTLMLIVTDVD